jgi:tetratricopeptide (TPR) repeat protein
MDITNNKPQPNHMLQKTITTAALATTLALLLALTGCAHRQPRPDSASAQKKQHRVKQADAEKPADPTAAKLTFTSSGMPMAVGYWTSTSTQMCDAFQPVGRVFDSGRKVLLPWIANMTEKMNKAVLHNEVSRTQYVQPGVPIQVKGVSGNPDDRRFDSCGPLVTLFTPEPGKKYVVDFDFNGRASCSQSVMDVTDPDHPVPAGRPVACAKVSDYATLYDREKKNYLKADHEQELSDAQRDEAAATSDADKASAMKKEAAALDSLDRSKEALEIVDRALSMAGAPNRRDLIATKAGILFNLNDPQAALALLAPELDDVRKRAASQPAVLHDIALGAFNEGFVTATFAHMQLEQWKEAVDTLADAKAPLEGPGFLAYRGLIYRYIMARAQNPSLANTELEHDATDSADHYSGHYGVLLRMWRGDQTLEEMTGVLARMSGADLQEAQGEVDFYTAAYMKFVKANPVGAKAEFAELDKLAPYGSIEWIYGKRVLQ